MSKLHLKNLKVGFCHSRRIVEKRDLETNINEAADANVIPNIVEEDWGNLFDFLEKMWVSHKYILLSEKKRKTKTTACRKNSMPKYFHFFFL